MASAINSDNGVVSGSAGLKSSADSSGVLDLQTNGTTAISISASQVVTYTNQPTYTGGTANGVMYLNGSKAVTTGTALVFDGTNLGVGVTPSAWSTITALQVKNAFVGGLTNNAYFGANAYYNGTNYIYQASSFASLYFQSSGRHEWFNAPSGTAGNAITFTQAMTLDASSNLLVGATSSIDSSFRLQVTGAGGTISHSTGSNASSFRFTNTNTTSQWNFGMNSPGIQNAGDYMAIGRLPSGGSWSEFARITSAGVLDIGTGSGAVGQIQFPATQVASSNANTLDDYEEGTFTPTIVPGSGSISYLAQSGRYVKIGKMVQIWVYLGFTASAPGAIMQDLGGLPFNVDSTAVYPTIAIGNFYFINLGSGGTVLGVYPQPGTNTMRFHSNGSNTDQLSPQVTGGNMNIRMEGAYLATT
jgi:hypothetical protein